MLIWDFDPTYREIYNESMNTIKNILIFRPMLFRMKFKKLFNYLKTNVDKKYFYYDGNEEQDFKYFCGYFFDALINEINDLYFKYEFWICFDKLKKGYFLRIEKYEECYNGITETFLFYFDNKRVQDVKSIYNTNFFSVEGGYYRDNTNLYEYFGDYLFEYIDDKIKYQFIPI
jgi:hypothetical protein